MSCATNSFRRLSKPMKMLAAKNKITPRSIALTAVVMLLLTFFCHAAQLSLVIPLLLLFLSVHFFHFKKASGKLFLDLGLLLSLLVFIANVAVQYRAFHPFYIAVSSVAMLTMLLYNDLQLAFLISFVSSVLVALIVGLNFNL